MSRQAFSLQFITCPEVVEVGGTLAVSVLEVITLEVVPLLWDVLSVLGPTVLVTVTVLIPPLLPIHPLMRETSRMAIKLIVRAFLRIASPLTV